MINKQRLGAALPSWAMALQRTIRSGAMFTPYVRFSFAQEGEDLLLARLFEGQPTGFYVDVGAHHPTRFSNTHLLYRRGWRGINVDATPGSMEAFSRKRPRDINLELAVSSQAGVMRFHVFDEPALNSLDEVLSNRRASIDPNKVLQVVDVPAQPLSDILSEHLPDSVEVIDLLTIDVEGHDADVLESNDWERFRPRVLLIEALESTVSDLPDRPEIQQCVAWGYRPFAKLVNSVFLLDARER